MGGNYSPNEKEIPTEYEGLVWLVQRGSGKSVVEWGWLACAREGKRPFM
jgi:hypothetical protein